MSRKPVVDKALLRRVAVNLLGNEGSFIGYLAEYDSETYVFDQCETIPAAGETPRALPGRHYIDRINCWLQELPT